jgi:hypothetical protein
LIEIDYRAGSLPMGASHSAARAWYPALIEYLYQQLLQLRLA